MLIKKMLFAYYETQCLYAVSQLKIADHLKSNKKSISELAVLTACDENKLYRLLRFVSAKGLFDELPERIFSLNDESHFLLSSTAGNLNHFIHLHSDYFYQAASEISNSLQSELSAFEVKFGKPAWRLFEEDQQLGHLYHSAMQDLSDYYGKLAVKRYDFSSYRTIIDVGGGLGSFLVNILKENRLAKGINFDLPILQQEAEIYFKKENLVTRLQYIAGSFFEFIPTGGELYVFKAIFHGKTDEQALLILNNTKKVLPKNGKILLVERMITSDSDFVEGCVNDMNMLTVTRGVVRTFEEYHALFSASGFIITKNEALDGAIKMLELSLTGDTK